MGLLCRKNRPIRSKWAGKPGPIGPNRRFLASKPISVQKSMFQAWKKWPPGTFFHASSMEKSDRVHGNPCSGTPVNMEFHVHGHFFPCLKHGKSGRRARFSMLGAWIFVPNWGLEAGKADFRQFWRVSNPKGRVLAVWGPKTAPKRSFFQFFWGRGQ